MNTTNKQLKAPFGWVGGKSKLAKDIVAAMPDHRLYVEVFGGALNVLYAKQSLPEQSKQRSSMTLTETLSICIE